jgi:hypothetical protein
MCQNSTCVKIKKIESKCPRLEFYFYKVGVPKLLSPFNSR